MGCGGTKGGDIVDDDGDSTVSGGQVVNAALRTNNAKGKWKNHKGPIDMDLLKELGLDGEDDEERKNDVALEDVDSPDGAAGNPGSSEPNKEGEPREKEKTENG